MGMIMTPLISHVASQYDVEEWVNGTPTSIPVRIPEGFIKFLTSVAEGLDGVEKFELFEIYFQHLIISGLMLDSRIIGKFMEDYADRVGIEADQIVDRERSDFAKVLKRYAEKKCSCGSNKSKS